MSPSHPAPAPALGQGAGAILVDNPRRLLTLDKRGEEAPRAQAFQFDQRISWYLRSEERRREARMSWAGGGNLHTRVAQALNQLFDIDLAPHPFPAFFVRVAFKIRVRFLKEGDFFLRLLLHSQTSVVWGDRNVVPVPPRNVDLLARPDLAKRVGMKPAP